MIVYVFIRAYDPMPSRAAPTAMSTAPGRVRNTSTTGTRTRWPAWAIRWNTGVSDTDQRRYSETSSSGSAVRNGMRQPHSASSSALKLSVMTMKTTADRIEPIGRSQLRDRGEERVTLLRRVLGRDQDGATPLAAERDALHEAQQHEQHGAEPAHLAEGRQQSDEPGRDAHDGDRDQERRAPADPVTEVSEEDGTERAHEEGGADRGERARPPGPTRRAA